MRTLALTTLLLLGCQSSANVGATCTRASDCGSLVCALGRCRAGCRAQRDCSLGATCLVGSDGVGSCALPDDPDCRTSGCPAPYACVGTTCVNLCASVTECVDGSACVATGDGRARCVRTDVDAGPPIDAAVIDAPSDAGACLPPSCDPPVQIAAGDNLTCVRTQRGALHCWGAVDAVGRGNDATGCDATGRCPVPAAVRQDRGDGTTEPAHDVTWLSVWQYVGCYTSASQPVRCWSGNAFGLPLGTDASGFDFFARAVSPSITSASEVHLATSAALAIGATMPWYAWGSDAMDEYGVPGSETIDSFASPITPPVPMGSTVRMGAHHGCGISSGTVSCWGANDVGQAGAPTTTAQVSPAAIVSGVSGAIELALGDAHTCALLGTGDVTCWGSHDALGVTPDPPTCAGAMSSDACTPTTIFRASGTRYTHLATGGRSALACAIDDSQRLWCWGSDYLASSNMPALVRGMPMGVTAAAVSWSHVCAIVGTEVYCYGENDWGQLGRDTMGMPDETPRAVVWR
jgi:hypothetical protein